MQSEKLTELLHQYFELGVAEGREGRNHDTEAGDAQRVLSEIEAEIAALSTDAEPVAMDDEDRTPMPAGFDDALWRKADEVHHAMALVARDQECVKIIYAALSTHNAEPVKTAPAVAVTDGLREAIEKLLDQAEHVCLGAHTPLDIKESAKNLAEPIKNLHAALSAQVQDVAGWQAGINEAISVADSEAEMWGHEDGSSARVVAARLRTLLSASPASKHGDAE